MTSKKGKPYSDGFITQTPILFFLQETYSTQSCHDIWRNQWGGEIIFSDGTNHGKGVALLIKPRFDMQVKSIRTDEEGRYLIVDATIQDTTFKCINIYAPNEANTSAMFYSKLKIKLEEEGISCFDYIIWCGDFNIFFDPQLERKGGSKNIVLKENSINVIDEMVQNLDINDSWRLKNPSKKRFTWRQSNPAIHSRLDYWFISDTLFENILEIDIIPAIRSDHSAIKIHISSIDPSEKGRGYWKLNSTILEEEPFITSLNKEKNQWVEETADWDSRLRWEYIKFQVRDLCINYSKSKARQKRNREQSLQKEQIQLVEKLDETEENEAEYVDLQNNLEEITKELDKIEKYKTEGVILRSKIRWYEQGEKSNKYFMNMESRNFSKKKC